MDREQELSLLLEMLNRSKKEGGQVLFLAGEGGVGKTRLVLEFAHQITGRGAFFAMGRAYEDESLVPYSPWIEVIRSIHQSSPDILRGLPKQTLAEVRKLVPDLKMGSDEVGIKKWIAGPEIGGIVYSGAEIENVRLFQTITDFMIHAASERQLVLFLDDVLWADEASLQLLHYFSRQIRKARIMVVAAYRDPELTENHPLSRLITNMKREGTIEQFSIQRLNKDHVSRIISNYNGGEAVAPRFTGLIYEKTGGNPLFVEEILRSLSEEERVYKSQDGWALKEPSSIEIPSTIKALATRRISRLPKEVVQILSAGSVMGMQFEYDVLKRVGGEDEEQTISCLEEATKAGLLSEKRAGSEISYTFSDEQVKDVLYDRMSLIRKRRLHTQVAQTLEELSQNSPGSRVEEIAYHYLLSGERQDAAKFSLAAGDRAATLYAHPEAKKHYSNALKLLGEQERGGKLEVLVKIGDSSYRMGEYDACLQSYREAAALATCLNHNRVLASIYSKLGEAQWFLSSDKKGALQSFDEGLRVLASEADTDEKAALYQNIARVLVITGEGDKGQPYCEEAVRIARQLDNHEILAHSLVTLAWTVEPAHKRRDEIFRYLEDALAVSTKHSLDVSGCRAYLNLGYAYARVDRNPVKARDILIKGLEYSRRTGYLHYQGHINFWLALYGYIPLGIYDRAFQISEERLGIGFGVADAALMSESLALLSFCALLERDVENAERKFEEAIRMAERSQWKILFYPYRLTFGKLLVRTNDLKRAEHHLLKAVESARLGRWEDPPIEAYIELVSLYSRIADLKNSEEYYARVKSIMAEIDATWAVAYERWAYAEFASAREDWNAAKDGLIKSRELWSRVNHLYNAAVTTVELGNALARAGEKIGAQKCLKEAKTIFASLGANPEVLLAGPAT